MIKCENCAHFKEHSLGEYECLKIYNITINDKGFEHECNLFKKPPEQMAQWVIDNRYPKNEFDKVSDFEMYHILLDYMKQ